MRICAKFTLAASIVIFLYPLSHAGEKEKVNINTASEKELAFLPGIGEKGAKRIIEYRKTYGNFSSLSEIKRVKGIGEGLFKKLEPYIILEGPTTAAEKIVVPVEKAAATGPKVNINRASKEELTALPGIGPSKADKIIEYRTRNGPFKRKEEIKEVRGIGERTYETLEGLITVE